MELSLLNVAERWHLVGPQCGSAVIRENLAIRCTVRENVVQLAKLVPVLRLDIQDAVAGVSAQHDTDEHHVLWSNRLCDRERSGSVAEPQDVSGCIGAEVQTRDTASVHDVAFLVCSNVLHGDTKRLGARRVRGVDSQLDSDLVALSTREIDYLALVDLHRVLVDAVRHLVLTEAHVVGATSEAECQRIVSGVPSEAANGSGCGRGDVELDVVRSRD